MPKTIFRGATIRYADLRPQREETGLFTRLHMTSDFSEPVRDAMGWSDFPDGISSAKLTGKLVTMNMVLTPSDKALKSELSIACESVSDFQVVRVSDGEDSSHVELRFVVRSSEAGAIALVEDYLRTAGGASARMTVMHSKQDSLSFQEPEAAEEDDSDEQPEEDDDSAPLPTKAHMERIADAANGAAKKIRERANA